MNQLKEDNLIKFIFIGLGHQNKYLFCVCDTQGCDASILLDSTPSGEHVEKEAAANHATLRGLEVIDEIKAQLEVECPDTVSCADILAFAAREAVALSGLSYYPVPGGRRDGLSSLAADVPANIPGPSSPIDAIAKIFLTKGLTIEEMVVLTGAHSIGSSHCKFFDYRLYNFNSTHKTDPSLDRFYAQYLSSFCPPQGSWLAAMMGPQAVNFDRVSPTRLDNEFCIKLLRGMALLQSDQAMASDPRTSKIVRAIAVQPVAWSKKFAKAMIRLGWVGCNRKIKHGYTGRKESES